MPSQRNKSTIWFTKNQNIFTFSLHFYLSNFVRIFLRGHMAKKIIGLDGYCPRLGKRGLIN